MKRGGLIFFLLVISIIIGLASCAKKQGTDTAGTKLTGKWKLAQTATDDNGNGQIDDNEIHPVPVVQDQEMTFNKDQTGVETNVYNGVTSTPLNFQWTINQDSVLCSFTGHDTINYYLANLSSGNLTLEANTSFGLAAYYYNRK